MGFAKQPRLPSNPILPYIILLFISLVFMPKISILTSTETEMFVVVVVVELGHIAAWLLGQCLVILFILLSSTLTRAAQQVLSSDTKHEFQVQGGGMSFVRRLRWWGFAVVRR